MKRNGQVARTLLAAASLGTALLAAGPNNAWATTASVSSIGGICCTNVSVTPLIDIGDGSLYGSTIAGGYVGWETGAMFRFTPNGTSEGNLVGLQLLAPGVLDGDQYPNNMIQGADGAFYITTDGGGPTLNGALLRMTTDGTTTIVTNLNFGVAQGGELPAWASLVSGPDGALYGVASSVAAHSRQSGLVFRVTLDGSVTVLHVFSSMTSGVNADGANPNALTLGTDGKLYGVTLDGGSNGAGTVFSIGTDGSFTTLHSFASSEKAKGEQAAVVQLANGTLYGWTQGAYPTIPTTHPGTLFSLTTGGQYNIVYNFKPIPARNKGANTSGAFPTALIVGSDGNLYGTAQLGGLGREGSLFQFTPGGQFTTLFNFNYLPAKYHYGHPQTLMQGRDGVLYGTTSDVGATIFKATLAN